MVSARYLPRLNEKVNKGDCGLPQDAIIGDSSTAIILDTD